MSLPTSVLVKVAAAGLIVLVAAATCLIVSSIGYKESRLDVPLANGFKLMFATRGEIKKAMPSAFAHDDLDSLSIHHGWFSPSNKLAIIYTTHSERFTAAALAPVPGICEKACMGLLTDADLKALDPEVRAVMGTMFHELVGHGSDSFAPNHLFTTMHLIWPEVNVPSPEPLQNPWRVLRRYWGADATHPLLETRDELPGAP